MPELSRSQRQTLLDACGRDPLGQKKHSLFVLLRDITKRTRLKEELRLFDFKVFLATRMSHARQRMELLQGSVEADSHGQHQGSPFRIWLPLA
ncbi:MAG: hypothetical protein G8237_13025 [Magnetococcales bacterium]|nr:hypothetical protein [Magnetococcales bacterium]